MTPGAIRALLPSPAVFLYEVPKFSGGFREWINDPTQLWNKAEEAEKNNPRALVMHEWEIGLPHMLTPAQRKAATAEMAQFIADHYSWFGTFMGFNPCLLD